MSQEKLDDIRRRLEKKTIHELRQIARAVGVWRPADGKKERLVEDIIRIASVEITPAPRSARGAPPKSSEYDRGLVAEIEELIKSNTVHKFGSGEDLEVSSGGDKYACSGILVKDGKDYFLRVNGWQPSDKDVFVLQSFITRFSLHEGDSIQGVCRTKGEGTVAGLISVTTVNGQPPFSIERKHFSSLTPVHPQSRLKIELSDNLLTRMADIFAPLGKGQRAVVTGESGSGKSLFLQGVIEAVSSNCPEAELIVLSVAARPEDVTSIKRACHDTMIIYSTFDMADQKHVEAAEFAINHCKSLTECGGDVVLVVDGLTQLEESARALGLRGEAKKLLASAICADEGGSLTVLAALSDDTADAANINPELILAANSRIALSLSLSEDGQPALDILKSGTSRSELLLSGEEFATAATLKKMLRISGNYGEILNIFKRTHGNAEIVKGY